MKGVAKASNEVALLVAKNMKAHTIGESTALPAAKILVENVIGVETAAKLKIISLSNNTVKNRIEKMFIDISDQVRFVKDSKFGFSMPLNESTDITNNAQLLVYVRYTTQDTNDMCKGICNRMIHFSYYCKYGVLVLVMTGQALLMSPKGRKVSRDGLVK